MHTVMLITTVRCMSSIEPQLLVCRARLLALAPHQVPASFAITLYLVFSFAALHDTCSVYERVRSKVTPRYTGYGSCFRR